MRVPTVNSRLSIAQSDTLLTESGAHRIAGGFDEMIVSHELDETVRGTDEAFQNLWGLCRRAAGYQQITNVCNVRWTIWNRVKHSGSMESDLIMPTVRLVQGFSEFGSRSPVRPKQGHFGTLDLDQKQLTSNSNYSKVRAIFRQNRRLKENAPCGIWRKEEQVTLYKLLNLLLRGIIEQQARETSKSSLGVAPSSSPSTRRIPLAEAAGRIDSRRGG
jgi:hypothetical protein